MDVISIREWSNWMAEWLIVGILIVEFFYDKHKDDIKKQRKTRTSKKTTTNKEGGSTVEEVVEVSEPIEEKKQ